MYDHQGLNNTLVYYLPYFQGKFLNTQRLKIRNKFIRYPFFAPRAMGAKVWATECTKIFLNVVY